MADQHEGICRPGTERTLSGAAGDGLPAPDKPRRILCVFPRYARSFGTLHHAYPLHGQARAFMPPQGLLLVAAAVPDGWEVRFIDENVRRATEADYEWADAVFISGMHVQRDRIREVDRAAHRHGRVTVLGGPSVSASPEWYPEVDLLHIGELGDGTRALFDRLRRTVRRPPAQLRFETVIRTPLHEFPTPAYHHIDVRDYFIASIQYSSGCPFRCDFCDIPELYGRVPRRKMPKQVCAELDALMESGPPDAVYFVDDNFTGSQKTALELLPHLIEWQRRNGYPVNFACELSINVARNTRILELMREAWFHTVFVGIETPDEDSLRSLSKKQNLGMPLLDAIRILNDYGFEVVSGIIMGLDTDTEETPDRILEFIEASAIPMLTINLIYALPRTPLWRRLKAEGRILSDGAGGDASNVEFLLPREVVRAGWLRAVREANRPEALYRRFRHQMEHTFPNRFDPGDLRRVPAGAFRRGMGMLRRIFWRIGVRSDYRRTFWRFALPALRQGNIEALIHVPMVAHHLIRFARDCDAGVAEYSFYSPDGATEPVPTAVCEAPARSSPVSFGTGRGG